ncbi:hypothetical protein ABH994_005498 [Bradyrhizobium yuanmingense]|uniref:hypothetical protein n=1 Tax=Bradyrhizobium yuanmingense TaxID=108015 RepID=UPI0035157062
MKHDFVQSVPGNQRRDPGHENKILGDCILYSLQTTTEFINIGERRPLTNERVRLHPGRSESS